MAAGRNRLFFKALTYSFPVFLGYISIGFGFGLLLVSRSYPWWMAGAMCLIMVTGAGQFLAVGLFAAGAPLWEAALLQLVLSVRHSVYSLSMINRFSLTGKFKPYLIYSLTDETFAIFSSLPIEDINKAGQGRLMFYISILNQGYWFGGSLLGAIAGTLLPFDMAGIEFALTALFVVLMIEQYLKIKRKWPFFITALLTVPASLLLPARFSMLSALAFSLIAVQSFEAVQKRKPQC